MKIYTYYENINFDQQEELIDLWKLGWERNGFEPIVLDRSHAKKHPYYDEFIKKLEDVHLRIVKEPLAAYGLSCYLRWMAYAGQPNEKFYVSDYDVMNNGFKPVEPNKGLHFLHNCCPCLASGTPEQFDKLTHLFVDLSESRMSQIKEQIKQKKLKWYHDQEFLNCSLEVLRDLFIFSMSNGLWSNSSLVHFSHNHVRKLRAIQDDEVYRVHAVKQLLSI